MGYYDFFINTYLEIQHINGISYYVLPFKHRCYCELDCSINDSDEDEKDCHNNNRSIAYEKLYNDMKKICLTPSNPIIIYDNQSFIKPRYENKYLPFIQDKINSKPPEKPFGIDTGTFTSIDQIIKITKIESRCAPDEYR